MVKVRYFKIILPYSIQELEHVINRSNDLKSDESISIISSTSKELFLRYRSLRTITVTRITSEGEELKEKVPTFEILLLRIFSGIKGQYLSIFDPARSTRNLFDFLDQRIGPGFFVNAYEMNQNSISTFVKQFESAKLVSAKIRDFSPYEGAVGRLEISSKQGLENNIASFLEGKFYRTDSLTYEVIQGFKKGLVCYFSNGTIRTSDALKYDVIANFEKNL